MNKFKIKHLVIISIFLLTSCSYEPVFSNKDYGFEINEITLLGDKDINRNLKNNLNLIVNKGNSSGEKYNLSIDTEKERRVVSKDAQGDPLKFELILSSSIIISDNQKTLITRKISKNYIYNNISDKFELEQNERIIMENLSEKIFDIVISLLMNLNDN
tara:strand:- start:26 stop:502 length:477 start_codon:yes stop_codon:yes gene_type:complete